MPDGKHTGIERRTIDIVPAPGGWPGPWPNVAEIAKVLPTDKWTLVGGLMTQLHSIHHGLGVVRPTNDFGGMCALHLSKEKCGARANALAPHCYPSR